MKIQKNLTSTNTKITALADTIQKAREILSLDNKNIHLEPDDTRKIILVCLIFFRTKSNVYSYETITLKNVLDSLNMSTFDVFDLCTDDTIKSVELSGTISELSHMVQYPDWLDLIDYALEVLEYEVEEYFSIEIFHGTRNYNKKKKKNGIYYTPIDVVNFMVSKCIKPVLYRTTQPSILDCSCGSGVFLIQSLLYLENTYNAEHDLNTSINLLDKCIWGIDISPVAVDNCKAVLLQYFLDNYKNASGQLNKIWRTINKSIVIGDATDLNELLTKNISLPTQFDCIVGNPPYVTEGRDSNLFIPFVDNMINHSSDYSCSALILPLSICYSQGTEFVRLRNKIQNDNSTWTFINYDRSPDSLFGDQVKTRNTILFKNNTETTTDIFTSNLQRWTSVNRDSLFTNYDLCNISEISISKCVPKISHTIEKNVYERIRSGTSNLRYLFQDSYSKYPLIINGTAYNWLCAYDHIPPSTDENQSPYLSGTTKVHYLADRESRDFCIAMLSNRIAYWFWSVIGDGFHFNASFLSDFKIGKDTFTKKQYTELCRLGRLYSKQIKKHPTVSYNAGKKIVNYSHWEAMDTIQNIERIIIEAINLTDDFASYLDQWYFKQVHCNRDNEKR